MLRHVLIKKNKSAVKLKRLYRSFFVDTKIFAEGLDILKSAKNKNLNHLYLENLGDFIYHNIINGINAKKMNCLTCDAKAERDRKKFFLLRKNGKCSKAEIEIAKWTKAAMD